MGAISLQATFAFVYLHLCKQLMIYYYSFTKDDIIL